MHEILWWKETTTFSFAGDDTLGYLPRPIHKKYFMIFLLGNQISTCGSYDRFFDPTAFIIINITSVDLRSQRNIWYKILNITMEQAIQYTQPGLKIIYYYTKVKNFFLFNLSTTKFSNTCYNIWEAIKTASIYSHN